MEKNHRLSPLDVFLHLFMMITLYFVAAGFITLMFQYINILLPDPIIAHGYIYQEQLLQGPLRFALSTLIIVFPALLVTAMAVHRRYGKILHLRESGLRKWLMYFTLFAAAVIIGGDLVSIVHSYLGGELTWRFFLKAATFLFVAGVIFGYIIWDVRREIPRRQLRIFTAVITLIIAAAVVGAFFLVGSPSKTRELRFDQVRVSDLQNIGWQIDAFYNENKVMPASLAQMQQETAVVLPKDPLTGSAYEYIAGEGLSYQLCATFTRESLLPEGGQSALAPTDQEWIHSAGRKCFPRKVTIMTNSEPIPAKPLR